MLANDILRHQKADPFENLFIRYILFDDCPLLIEPTELKSKNKV